MSHDNCEHPERKPKDGKCSEEQIKKCHGKKKNIPVIAKNSNRTGVFEFENIGS